MAKRYVKKGSVVKVLKSTPAQLLAQANYRSRTDQFNIITTKDIGYLVRGITARNGDLPGQYIREALMARLVREGHLKGTRRK